MTITKLDVLDEVAEIAICVGYTLDGRVIDAPPSQIEDYARVLPIYETMPGWLAPTHTARRWEELPANAQAYVRRLAEVCGTTISMVSVGPGHEQIIEVVSAL